MVEDADFVGVTEVVRVLEATELVRDTLVDCEMLLVGVSDSDADSDSLGVTELEGEASGVRLALAVFRPRSALRKAGKSSKGSRTPRMSGNTLSKITRFCSLSRNSACGSWR